MLDAGYKIQDTRYKKIAKSKYQLNVKLQNLKHKHANWYIENWKLGFEAGY
jgi:hypothetical protein